MPDPSEAPPFPFFLGCGRSGTTLVRFMFDAHPQMAIPPGTRLVKRWAQARNDYERPDGFDVTRFEADLLGSEWLKRWEDGPGVVHRAIEGSPPNDMPDAVRRVYREFARSQNKTRYGNKSHGYVAVIPLIASLLPESRFVHIVRDGRNVALSLIQAPFGPTALEPAARFWRRRVEKGRADGMALGPTRYREVRYEDLVVDPQAELRPLCAFLDLPFDDAMLRYYEREAGTSRELKNPEIHRNLARPPTKNIRDWRDQMSVRDVARFESIAGPALEAFGYELANDVPRRYRVEQSAKRSLKRGCIRFARIHARRTTSAAGERHA